MKTKRRKYIFMALVIAVCIIAVTPIISAVFLNDLEDVTITTPITDGEFIRYNSTSANWTNVVYTGGNGNPFNQDLNTTDNVRFHNITADGNISIPTIHNRLWFGATTSIFRGTFNLSLESDLDIVLAVANGTAIIIDENAIISMRYQSGARARLAIAQPISSFTWTKLNLIVEDFDSNSDYDPITMRFVVPVTGVYQISYSARFETYAGTGSFISAIYVNGTIAGGYEICHDIAEVTGQSANSGADIMLLNKNDWIELWVWHNYGVGARICPAVAHSNYLAVHKIG